MWKDFSVPLITCCLIFLLARKIVFLNSVFIFILLDSNRYYRILSFNKSHPSSWEAEEVWDTAAKFHSFFRVQVEIYLCGLYPVQRINISFVLALAQGLAASEADSKMNRGGSEQFVFMQVVMVVSAAVHSGWWNVSLLCETWLLQSQWSLRLWLVAELVRSWGQPWR